MMPIHQLPIKYPDKDPLPHWSFMIWVLIACLVAFMIFMGFMGKAHAEEINVEKLATAIYYAEGGAISHPYGILAHYKYTTPRMACINTINHALKDFKGGDFIAFLGSRYAPLNVANDPTNLNANWVKNVKRIYVRLK